MHPERLKPSPYMLEEAMDRFSVPPSGTVFFGDSVSDMEAAAAAGTGFFGFRSSEKNRKRFCGVLEEDRIMEDWYGLGRLI